MPVEFLSLAGFGSAKIRGKDQGLEEVVSVAHLAWPGLDNILKVGNYLIASWEYKKFLNLNDILF